MALNVAVLIVSVAVLALVTFVIPVLLQLRRTAHAAEQALAAVEREIRPLTTTVQALVDAHRELAQRVNRNLQEVEGVVHTASEVVGRVAKVTSILAGVGAAGRVASFAQGLFKGVDMFIRLFGRRRR